MKKVIIHFLLALSVFVLVVLLTIYWMKSYTLHGEQILVPDFTDKELFEVEAICESLNIQYFVADSAFVFGKKAGLVYGQDPYPNTQVKKDRRIYLSITNNNVPEISLPRIEDLSLRQAQLVLNNLGLEVGEISTRPDIANVVLEVSNGKKRLREGDRIKKGTKLNLLVGIVGSDSIVNVPNLLGLSLEDGIDILRANGLNLGAILGADVITDSANAFITQQEPAYLPEKRINLGSYIDVRVRK